MERTEKPLSPKEVSISLGIGDSTLRKWCLALEAHEYFFSRTDNNRRVFFNKDIVVLRHLQHLIQVQNFSVENASLVVVAKFRENPSSNTNSENNVPVLRDSSEFMTKLMLHLEQQEDFNERLLERLDQQENLNHTLLERFKEQEKYIEERLNKRDTLLMQSLKESLETKKLLLAQQEEQKKKRKGLFSFFNKS